MFKTFKRMVYPVADLPQAGAWYRRILDRDPVLVSPVGIRFAIGTTELVLVPDAEQRNGAQRAIGAWEVEDVDAAYAVIVAAGGAPISEPRTIWMTRQASVADPFGNTLALTGSLDAVRRKTLAEVPSDSALAIALCRALAARDPRAEIRGADVLADVFLPDEMRRMLDRKDEADRLRTFTSKGGAYEYFLARTAYFDTLVQQAFASDIAQIVLLGAGYDTRGFRFGALNRTTRVFDLDIPPTQQRKQRCLAAAGLIMPERMTFVPIDFTRDSLDVVLSQAGYDPAERTLFVWEGVAYYLPPPAVDRTLELIRRCAPAGSAICFDYMIDAPDVIDRYGVRLAIESMRAHYPSEPVLSRIAEVEIDRFLAQRGFRQLEQLDAAEMERRFLTLADGGSAGKVLGLFNLIHAAVV